MEADKFHKRPLFMITWRVKLWDILLSLMKKHKPGVPWIFELYRTKYGVLVLVILDQKWIYVNVQYFLSLVPTLCVSFIFMRQRKGLQVKSAAAIFFLEKLHVGANQSIET